MIRFKLCKAYVTEIESNTKTRCSLDEFFARGIKTNFSYLLRRKYFFLNASTDLLALISFGVSFQVLIAVYFTPN